MSEFPFTMWGWITIVSGVALTGCVVWLAKFTPKPWQRGAAILAIISTLLLFLYAFMQWATWYI